MTIKVKRLPSNRAFMRRCEALVNLSEDLEAVAAMLVSHKHIMLAATVRKGARELMILQFQVAQLMGRRASDPASRDA